MSGALDYNKLKNYIEIMIHIYIRTDNGKQHIYRSFRNCRVSDFENRNYFPDEAFQEDLSKKNLCPDIQPDDELYRLESKYSNRTFRQSFSVEIMKCTNDTNPNCKDDIEIEQFLKQFYFTMYTLQERADFVDTNYGKYPLITQNSFHS